MASKDASSLGASGDADDALAAMLSTSFAVTKRENDVNREHPRFARYKNKGETSNAQERRRREVLNHQKKRREDYLSFARNLADGNTRREDEMDEDEEEEGDEGSMDMSEESREARYKPRRLRHSYRDQLMLSEWLVDVSEDFEDRWLLVKVPEGKRCLVVTGQGRTTSYLKSGRQMRSHPSLLPGGNYVTAKENKVSLLDCVFSQHSGTYYVIDVMMLGDTPFYECDTQFRFGYAKAKLFEDAGEKVGEKSKYNPCPFVPLPHFGCSKAQLSEALAARAFPPELKPDGLLFYHGDAHYLPGQTPLVGWLKGWMTEEVLGVKSPEAKPRGYTSQSGFIEEFNVERAKIAEERKEHWRIKAEKRTGTGRNNGEQMEAEEPATAE